jgi:hypothetical protein
MRPHIKNELLCDENWIFINCYEGILGEETNLVTQTKKNIKILVELEHWWIMYEYDCMIDLLM